MKYSRIGLTCLCLALLCPIRIAQADSWAAAGEITVQSGNRLYHARIIPGASWGDTGGFSGAQRGKYARAVLGGPGIRDRLTFTLLNPIAPVEAVLLDDGSLMTFDNWHNMGYGKVAVLYDRPSPTASLLAGGGNRPSNGRSKERHLPPGSSS